MHLRGEISWKHQDVFLTETLIGERVGLEPVDDRYWRVYFATFPIAYFDSRRLRMWPLPQRELFNMDEAGERESSPSPAPHPLTQANQKVSGMCPV